MTLLDRSADRGPGFPDSIVGQSERLYQFMRPMGLRKRSKGAINSCVTREVTIWLRCRYRPRWLHWIRKIWAVDGFAAGVMRRGGVSLSELRRPEQAWRRAASVPGQSSRIFSNELLYITTSAAFSARYKTSPLA